MTVQSKIVARLLVAVHGYSVGEQLEIIPDGKHLVLAQDFANKNRRVVPAGYLDSLVN